MRTIASWALDKIWSAIKGGKELTFNQNLLKVKIGDSLFIKSVMYNVTSINMITETVGNKSFTITIYNLYNSETIKREDTEYSLWVYPAEFKEDKFLMLFFEKTYSAGYGEAESDGLTESLSDKTGEIINHYEDAEITYKRRFNDKEVHHVKSLLYTEDGKTNEYNWSYWDYELETPPDQFNTTNGYKYPPDYMFITESSEGWFEIFEGDQVNYEEITIL